MQCLEGFFSFIAIVLLLNCILITKGGGIRSCEALATIMFRETGI